MIVVEGTIKVRDLEKARPHMRAMIRASRAEEGCVDYSYAEDILEPGLIRVNERWTDRAALNRHIETDHIAIWRASWEEIGVSGRSLRLYDAEAEAFQSNAF